MVVHAALPCAQELGPRLAAVESRLSGVYNLGGHMIVLDQMAAEFGLSVPGMDKQTPAEQTTTGIQANAPSSADWPQAAAAQFAYNPVQVAGQAALQYGATATSTPTTLPVQHLPGWSSSSSVVGPNPQSAQPMDRRASSSAQYDDPGQPMRSPRQLASAGASSVSVAAGTVTPRGSALAQQVEASKLELQLLRDRVNSMESKVGDMWQRYISNTAKETLSLRLLIHSSRGCCLQVLCCTCSHSTGNMSLLGLRLVDNLSSIAGCQPHKGLGRVRRSIFDYVGSAARHITKPG